MKAKKIKNELAQQILNETIQNIEEEPELEEEIIKKVEENLDEISTQAQTEMTMTEKKDIANVEDIPVAKKTSLEKKYDKLDDIYNTFIKKVNESKLKTNEKNKKIDNIDYINNSIDYTDEKTLNESINVLYDKYKFSGETAYNTKFKKLLQNADGIYEAENKQKKKL